MRQMRGKRWQEMRREKDEGHTMKDEREKRVLQFVVSDLTP